MDSAKSGFVLTRPALIHAAEFGTKRVDLIVPPAPPAKDEGYRPMTSSTKRLSFSTIASSRTIKYGKGKFAGVELSPQPSDFPEDPLNWEQWRKELNFAALMLIVGLIGGMKTAFVSTNGVMATTYNASYSSVTALTAAPLILSAFTGAASLIVSKMWGKRPVYLVSMALVFIGSMWNMRTLDSYAQCMAARVFQGLGWGAFDTLVLGSIQDTFFEHERGVRVAIYNVVAVATTWGAPLFGGLASRNAGRFTLQFEIINSFMAIALPLIVLGVPETNFDRSWSMMNTPAGTFGPHRRLLIPRGRLRITKRDVKEYLENMLPWSYDGERSLLIAMQAPKALIAPTTGLLFMLTFLPYCSLWGLSQTLSFLFLPAPFSLSESSVANILAAPFVLSVLTVGGIHAYRAYRKEYTPQSNAITIGVGAFLAVTGILAFGIEIHNFRREIPFNEDGSLSDQAAAIMQARVSYPLVSILLGLLATGTYMLKSTVEPLIWRSAQFTSSNLGVCIRNVADMNAGVTFWQNLFAGIFVQVLPRAIDAGTGLRPNVIGIGVAQAVLATGLAATWWFYDENIRRLDGRIMGLVDLSMLKRAGSFFDHD